MIFFAILVLNTHKKIYLWKKASIRRLALPCLARRTSAVAAHGNRKKHWGQGSSL